MLPQNFSVGVDDDPGDVNADHGGSSNTQHATRNEWSPHPP
jgi:hypothetical protein